MKGKVRYLTAMFLCIASMSFGVEVISVDINNYGNDTAYSGEAAVAGATEWVVYYGGWGEPAGSGRTADLARGGTVQGSTYAEQVWLGDTGGHAYISGQSDGLLDDGFASSNPSLTLTGSDPNLTFIAAGMFADAAGGAYGGTFDMYVYSDSAGYFMLADANAVDPLIYAEGSVTGTTSGFVEGENYVVFRDITIDDANSLYLWYSNEINGIQLVGSRGVAKEINPDSADPNDYYIDAVDYDFAYDTNARDGELTLYGPDTGEYVHYLDSGEFMGYDIYISPENEGRYDISALVVTKWGAAELKLYLDDYTSAMGTLSYATLSSDVGETNAVRVNLFEGIHTVRWAAESTNIYFDVVSLKFDYVGPIDMEDCDEVIFYGKKPAGDVNSDCVVNMDDLAVMISEWAASNDPE